MDILCRRIPASSRLDEQGGEGGEGRSGGEGGGGGENVKISSSYDSLQ